MSEEIQCQNIVESLRNGIPPQKGVGQYSVGNENLIDGVRKRHLSGIESRGIIRFISGSWGTGKTHFFRELREVGFEEGLLVSNVELDVNNAALDKFEKVLQQVPILAVDLKPSDGIWVAGIDVRFDPAVHR